MVVILSFNKAALRIRYECALSQIATIADATLDVTRVTNPNKQYTFWCVSLEQGNGGFVWSYVAE